VAGMIISEMALNSSSVYVMIEHGKSHQKIRLIVKQTSLKNHVYNAILYILRNNLENDKILMYFLP